MSTEIKGEELAKRTAKSLREYLTLKTIEPNKIYEAVYLAERMGNTAPIAFGGCLLSQCILAAHYSLPSSPLYHVYSCNATYLGPASTVHLTRYHIEDIRTTRSFATRKVEAWQDLGEGRGKGLRRCMIMLVDFHVQEESMHGFVYQTDPIHPPPSGSLSKPPPDHPEPNDPLHPTYLEYLTANHPPKLIEGYKRLFPLTRKYFEVRPNTASTGVARVLGLVGKAKEVEQQRKEHITRRTNSGWWRLFREKQEGVQHEFGIEKEERGRHAAAIGYITDTALSFLPLVFSSLSLGDAAACSSLDLSLRFFNPHLLNMNEWVYQEQHTEIGSDGRTFSTGRVWEGKEGRPIAVMTQSSIMRKWPDKEAKL